MKRLIARVAIASVGVFSSHLALAGNDEDLRRCKIRQVEIAQQAVAFKGEERTKRLIEADLRRASREEMEGDGDECLEALDHAAALLAGKF